MKKFLCLLLCMVMALGVFSACGNTEPAPEAEKPAEAPAEDAAAPEEATPDGTREYTDDTGRTLTIPAEIKKVAVSGPLTQIYAYPVCYDILAGFSKSFSGDAAKFIPEKYLSYPELGQLYGGKGTMDLEVLLAADPDVVIDMGEAKKNIVEDLDGLTEQTGIPFIHIDATVQTTPEAFRKLGELVGKEDRAEVLAKWCEECYANMESMMEKVDADGKRKTLVYCLGDKGLNVLAEGSFHAETLNMMAKNVADIADVVSSGMGNEVDMEQLILWNPEVIIFAPDSIYDSLKDSSYADAAAWGELDAVKNGEFYKTPFGPYGWLASPPSVQRYLGMLWLGQLLYPEYVDYDLKEEVTEYYRLFYGYDMTDAVYEELTACAFK